MNLSDTPAHDVLLQQASLVGDVEQVFWRHEGQTQVLDERGQVHGAVVGVCRQPPEHRLTHQLLVGHHQVVVTNDGGKFVYL
jgi:hypothetical protein